ncbi:hypothetical protein OAI84_00030 [bacterium]|nr:hypothetical protein [bacterium]
MLESLNNSKYFAGIIMIMLNIGSKYTTIELSKTQKQFFKSSIFRQLMIFTIVWSATKDIIISLILTASFHVLTNYLFNEKCKYCIIPKRWQEFEESLDFDKNGVVTDNEVKRAISILKKAKIQNSTFQKS